MKTLITIFATACLLWFAGAGWAIDKSRKETKPPDPKNTTETKADSTRDTATGGRSTGKNYDNFIDRNNNGIDDRAEKNKPTTTTKEKSPEQKSTTVPPKP